MKQEAPEYQLDNTMNRETYVRMNRWFYRFIIFIIHTSTLLASISFKSGSPPMLRYFEIVVSKLKSNPRKTWQNLTYVENEKDRRETYSLLENWYVLPEGERITRATSASQRTESSKAFFRSPFRRFENVTCLFMLFSILFSCTLPLPIFYPLFFRRGRQTTCKEDKDRSRSIT